MSEELIPRPTYTEKEFGAIFAKLAVQLRWLEADVAGAQSYFEILKDFPISVLDETAKQFAREHGRKFFPSTAEWHEKAQAIFERTLRKTLIDGREWHMDCETCEDTGWVYHDCPTEPCGRPREHTTHPWVSPCPCRATNRTYQRHQRFGAGE